MALPYCTVQQAEKIAKEVVNNIPTPTPTPTIRKVELDLEELGCTITYDSYTQAINRVVPQPEETRIKTSTISVTEIWQEGMDNAKLALALKEAITPGEEIDVIELKNIVCTRNDHTLRIDKATFKNVSVSEMEINGDIVVSYNCGNITPIYAVGFSTGAFSRFHLTNSFLVEFYLDANRVPNFVFAHVAVTPNTAVSDYLEEE